MVPVLDVATGIGLPKPRGVVSPSPCPRRCGSLSYPCQLRGSSSAKELLVSVLGLLAGLFCVLGCLYPVRGQGHVGELRSVDTGVLLVNWDDGTGADPILQWFQVILRCMAAGVQELRLDAVSVKQGANVHVLIPVAPPHRPDEPHTLHLVPELLLECGYEEVGAHEEHEFPLASPNLPPSDERRLHLIEECALAALLEALLLVAPGYYYTDLLPVPLGKAL